MDTAASEPASSDPAAAMPMESAGAPKKKALSDARARESQTAHSGRPFSTRNKRTTNEELLKKLLEEATARPAQNEKDKLEASINAIASAEIEPLRNARDATEAPVLFSAVLYDKLVVISDTLRNQTEENISVATILHETVAPTAAAAATYPPSLTGGRVEGVEVSPDISDALDLTKETIANLSKTDAQILWSSSFVGGFLQERQVDSVKELQTGDTGVPLYVSDLAETACDDIDESGRRNDINAYLGIGGNAFKTVKLSRLDANNHEVPFDWSAIGDPYLMRILSEIRFRHLPKRIRSILWRHHVPTLIDETEAKRDAMLREVLKTRPLLKVLCYLSDAEMLNLLTRVAKICDSKYEGDPDDENMQALALMADSGIDGAEDINIFAYEKANTTAKAQHASRRRDRRRRRRQQSARRTLSKPASTRDGKRGYNEGNTVGEP